MRVEIDNSNTIYGNPLKLKRGEVIDVELTNDIKILLNSGAIKPVYDNSIESSEEDEFTKSLNYTYSELKKMNKKEQTELIRELTNEKVPRYEEDRIQLILKKIKG